MYARKIESELTKVAEEAQNELVKMVEEVQVEELGNWLKNDLLDDYRNVDCIQDCQDLDAFLLEQVEMETNIGCDHIEFENVVFGDDSTNNELGKLICQALLLTND